eukprot:760381-Hanusia_phi.AAC.3
MRLKATKTYSDNVRVREIAERAENSTGKSPRKVKGDQGQATFGWGRWPLTKAGIQCLGKWKRRRRGERINEGEERRGEERRGEERRGRGDPAMRAEEQRKAISHTRKEGDEETRRRG